MALSDAYYEAVATEISSGQIDKTTWTKAFAHSGGNHDAAKSLYCRYRAEQLADQSRRRTRQVRATHAKQHGKQLLWGSVALVIGIGITIVSYASTAAGGHYFVATGLIVGGFVFLCRGFAGVVRAGVSPASKSKSDEPVSVTCIMPGCEGRCTITGHARDYSFYRCSQGHEFSI